MKKFFIPILFIFFCMHINLAATNIVGKGYTKKGKYGTRQAQPELQEPYILINTLVQI